MIKLNDILHLSDEEINKSKLALNMSFGGESHFKRWYESDPVNRDTNFSYYSHQGGNRNFFLGTWCFGFVRLVEDPKKWLFITAGEITKVPEKEKPGTCEHKDLERFSNLIGRMIVRIDKGNTFSRYVFNMSKFIDEAEVVEILPNIYEPMKFDGYNNVKLTFCDLKHIIDGYKYSGYRDALKSVKGIYCLTDCKTGKLYIGSAYGKEGVAQRWNNYLENRTGNNEALIELYKKEGKDYFENNFIFTLLETFSLNISDETIIHRENYWKEALVTRKYGYNKN